MTLTQAELRCFLGLAVGVKLLVSGQQGDGNGVTE